MNWFQRRRPSSLAALAALMAKYDPKLLGQLAARFDRRDELRRAANDDDAEVGHG